MHGKEFFHAGCGSFQFALEVEKTGGECVCGRVVAKGFLQRVEFLRIKGSGRQFTEGFRKLELFVRGHLDQVVSFSMQVSRFIRMRLRERYTAATVEPMRLARSGISMSSK